MVESTNGGHAVRNPLKRSTIPGRTSTKRSTSAVDRRPARREIAQRVVGVDAHRLEHGRRLEHLGRARRARVHGDAVLVEREQDRLGLDAVDADAHEVRERLGPDRRSARRRDARADTVAAGAIERALRVPLPPDVDAGRTPAPNPTPRGHVLDAAAPRPLLRAADEERREAQAAAHEQRAGAFRAAPSLWAVTERGRRRARRTRRQWPAAAHASTCTSTPRSARRGARPPPTGWTVPTSWFASCTDTSAVSGASPRATVGASKRPSRSTATTVSRHARARSRRARRVLDRGGHDVAARYRLASTAPQIAVFDRLGAR